MINENSILEIPSTGPAHFHIHHEFGFFIEKIDDFINFAKYFIKNTDINNIEYIRITHRHECFDIGYFNEFVTDTSKEKINNLLETFKLKGLILRDNNLHDNVSFGKNIIHQGYPYFLGMTWPQRFKISNRKFDKKFLCLNMLPRPHKKEIVEWFYNQNLDENSYLTHNFEVFDKPPKTILFNPEYDVAVSSPFSMSTYIPTILNHKSFCNIVTETFCKTFNEGPYYTFITEKIEKCFSAGQPFIVASTPHFLKKLKELGYQTFDKWWDESYDSETDYKRRLTKIYRVIKTINSLPYDRLEEMYYDMQETLIHNQMVNKEWYYKNIKYDGL